ncbi:MAG: hypothetical protein ABI703_12025 [Gemmatimonadales bacterium]
MSTPLYLTAPAADARLFIAEKTGGIRIVKDGVLLTPGGSILSFGEDSSGELYVLQAGGGVFKIVPEP